MSLYEQEKVLIDKLREAYALEDEITKALAKVRGGHKHVQKEIDRPDEAILKS